MTLKEKFKQWLDTEPRIQIREVQLEVIADDYAIEFAEWILWQDITQRGKSNFVCDDGVQRSMKQLLEVFKIENGYDTNN